MRSRIAAVFLTIMALFPSSAWADTLSPAPPLPVLPIQPMQPLVMCVNPFSDVTTLDIWYDAVRNLSCAGVISGYADGTFRPFNDLTRAQWVTWVVSAMHVPSAKLRPGEFTFTDVDRTSPWSPYVESAYAAGLISGFLCGGPGEPCDAQSRLYFHPNTVITRAQAIRPVVRARGWTLLAPASQTFADVPPSHPWYGEIEAAAAHGLVAGYLCGGPGEPCDSLKRPYFRPFLDLGRGNGALILYRAL